jgi:hypothetical protein
MQTCIQINSYVVFICILCALSMFHQNIIRKLSCGFDDCRVSSRVSSHLGCGNRVISKSLLNTADKVHFCKKDKKDKKDKG